MSVNNNGLNFWMPASQAEFYLGDPRLDVPAFVTPGSTLRASRFSVRCWKESDAMRVVIYAVVNDALTPKKELETAIATYRLTWDRSARVTVTETADWGAEPMIIRAVRPLR